MESDNNKVIGAAQELLDLLTQISQSGPFVFSLCLNVVLFFGIYKITRMYISSQKVNGSLKMSMMHMLSSEMEMSYHEAKARIRAMSNIEE